MNAVAELKRHARGVTAYPTSGERLGALLRRERLISGLTQQGLAERIGILQPRLARWETGRHPPSFEQLDRVLAFWGLRLRLDVELRPDPAADWREEQVRLAGLTPAERLTESELLLAGLVGQARKYGVEAVIDGQIAAWLQGVPGKPRRMQIAVTPDQVIEWLSLQWVVRYAADEDLMAIHLPRDEMAVEIISQGGGLINTSAGFVRLRVTDEAQPTIRLCIQDEGEYTRRLEAEVIRLEALPEHLQRSIA